MKCHTLHYFTYWGSKFLFLVLIYNLSFFKSNCHRDKMSQWMFHLRWNFTMMFYLWTFFLSRHPVFWVPWWSVHPRIDHRTVRPNITSAQQTICCDILLLCQLIKVHPKKHSDLKILTVCHSVTVRPTVIFIPKSVTFCPVFCLTMLLHIIPR